jgi:hypothetical protein
MRTFIIEREVPGIGARPADKTFCVSLAENQDLMREHARCSGFPANRITEVKAIMDPSAGRA